ncbi:ABC transporter ATP-binding protein [Pelagicoccus sp. SDUM812003]|uniref:ABC transporter ATP-binding protein n=1 Tax=Pelagicoccus sp. SDUM812003 TaxID=3041267 RepID=UPI00280E42B7|nr:ABC transporter ATP-binding protein [Pelagicoccus sp. SDUM812003]MDQ8203556.1 ABC transporter ATP-binding protein [Pelagicoccus sp. SDUM812003]
MTSPLEINQLTKRFDLKVALDEITTACKPGSIVGLLGPNGSGKTTLLRSVVGLVLPSSGSIRTLGVPADAIGSEALSQIGFVQQESDFLDWLTVDEHLRYIASYYKNWDRQRETELVEAFHLDREAKVATLSTGDRQKLAIALAVCHHPKLLLLDEPASALDPESRANLLRFLLSIASTEESSIIISSHILVDVEKVIDHVWFLKSGQLIADSDLDELKERYAEWTVSAAPGQALPERFEEAYVLQQHGDFSQRVLLVRDPETHRSAFETSHGLEIRERSLNLEAIYPLLSSTSNAPRHATV